MVCLCLFIFEIHLCTKRSYFLQNWVLQSLIKVLFSFLKKRGHPEYVLSQRMTPFPRIQVQSFWGSELRFFSQGQSSVHLECYLPLRLEGSVTFRSYIFKRVSHKICMKEVGLKSGMSVFRL